MKPYLDEEEKELIEAYERGEFKPVKNQQAAKAEAEEAARNYLRKDARITIRLSSIDLERLKRKAAIEGLPYQTYIASVLHKSVSM
jgi:predicted DNA binding CopG/RHH family protein